MKTQRILGILWLALCGPLGILVSWELSHNAISNPQVVASSPRFYFATLLCLLYLAGGLTGIFLYRGTPWAHRFVGLIAALILIVTVAKHIFTFGTTIWCDSVAVFALVSLVLLFLPRHEPVA